jgi:hypothetical protein
MWMPYFETRTVSGNPHGTFSSRNFPRNFDEAWIRAGDAAIIWFAATKGPVATGWRAMTREMKEKQLSAA